ncbi:MAG: hypothetical protein LBG11_04575 [Bifidobacteriaceae bacterium]|jgi:hypothetical protein|nr:hypothetical protein [Bifidobacteriaceae bacterium]
MRKRTLALLSGLIAAVTLTACGGDSETDTGDPITDDGSIPKSLLLGPTTGPDDQLVGLDEELKTAEKPEDGWISAPWADAATPDPEQAELRIIYVAGDTECYAHAGFTAQETNSEVTIGSYVKKAEGASGCPSSPAAAYKWGTVKLAEPLGDRKLVHAGVANLYKDFAWPKEASNAPEDTSGEAPDEASNEAPEE